MPLERLYLTLKLPTLSNWNQPTVILSSVLIWIAIMATLNSLKNIMCQFKVATISIIWSRIFLRRFLELIFIKRGPKHEVILRIKGKCIISHEYKVSDMDKEMEVLCRASKIIRRGRQPQRMGLCRIIWWLWNTKEVISLSKVDHMWSVYYIVCMEKGKKERKCQEP